MSLSKSEIRINQLTDDRNRSLRSLASLLAAGKEGSAEYKALEQAIADADEHIGMLKRLVAHPSIQAINAKEEAEQRDRVHQQLTKNVVTAVVDAIPTPAKETENRAAVLAAYRNFLKTGELPETRDLLQTGTGIALVPQMFNDAYKQALKVVSPLAATVQSMESSRIAKQFSVSDVSSDQRLLVETSPASPSSDPLFNSFTPTSTDSGVSVVRVSWQLLNDSAFPMEQFISTITKGRVARFYDAAILRGTDAFGTALPNSVAGGLLGAVTSGVVQSGSTGALATGPAFIDFVALVNALSDVAYNDEAAFLVSPKTRSYILKNFLTTTGKPIYKFDDNGNLMLLGKYVYTSSYFPTYGASTVQALYGDFSRSFVYQYSNSLYQANPLPEKLETEFVIASRFAGSPTQIAPKALVSLTTAAS